MPLRPLLRAIVLACVVASLPAVALAQVRWVTSWAASVQGPYPVGNPSAQPDLSRVFPSPANGARDQSFRLVVAPGFWGGHARVRFSNALGTKPVTFDGAFVGLQWSGSAVIPGTQQPLTFGGRADVTVPRCRSSIRARSCAGASSR
jgi:hypothetical protein